MVVIAKETYNPIEEKELHGQQLLELRKINIQLSLLTDNDIKEHDVEEVVM